MLLTKYFKGKQKIFEEFYRYYSGFRLEEVIHICIVQYVSTLYQNIFYTSYELYPEIYKNTAFSITCICKKNTKWCINNTIMICRIYCSI